MLLRDWTQDAVAFKEVYLDNEYRLPDTLDAHEAVLDIGAQIGCFALAAYKRGARNIHCYEPEPNNFQVLTKNVQPYPRAIRAERAAIYRSDERCDEPLKLLYPHNAAYTATYQVRPMPAGEEENAFRMRVYPLDQILARLGRVGLLKIDCEGSEYPILYTSKLLHQVERIVGEAHDLIPHLDWPTLSTANALASFLTHRGFEVELERQASAPDTNCLFFARRRK